MPSAGNRRVKPRSQRLGTGATQNGNLEMEISHLSLRDKGGAPARITNLKKENINAYWASSATSLAQCRLKERKRYSFCNFKALALVHFDDVLQGSSSAGVRNSGEPPKGGRLPASFIAGRTRRSAKARSCRSLTPGPPTSDRWLKSMDRLTLSCQN